MNTFSQILQLISTGSMGIFVGALLAEGALLVPYWQSLSAKEFFTLYKQYGPRLYRFYSPLTTIATLLAVASAMVNISTASQGQLMSIVSSILALVMIGIYMLYFRQANAKFATAAISDNQLPIELARWAYWHWVRVIIGLLAFASSLYALNRC